MPGVPYARRKLALDKCGADATFTLCSLGSTGSALDRRPLFIQIRPMLRYRKEGLGAVLWRIDRVVQVPPERRALLFFVGYVSAKTMHEAWATAQTWFPANGPIVVRAMSSRGMIMWRNREPTESLRPGDNGT